MAISYKVVSKRPAGVAGHSETMYYPVLTDRSKADLNEVCRLIAQSSTFSGADVVGVIQALIHFIPNLLQDGRSVCLDGLGTFNVHASAKGQSRPDKVTSRDITGLKISFLPSKEIKRKMTLTKFRKV